MLACAAAAQAADPGSLKAACSTRTPQPGYSFEYLRRRQHADVRTHAERRRRAAASGCRRSTTASRACRAKAADADSVPGADADGFIALDVDISRAHDARAAGRLPADRRSCTAAARATRPPGRRPASTPPASAGTTTTPGSRRAATWCVNYTSRGFRNQAGGRRLDRRDAARLAPLRDQRLPAPRGPGRRRPVLQREPAEGRRRPAAPTAAASPGWRSPTRSGRAPAART